MEASESVDQGGVPMLQRAILGLLVLFSFSAHGAVLDAKTAYYGRNLSNNLKTLMAGNSLKDELHLVLSGSHTMIKGDYDKIANTCWPGGGDCYRHTAVGYKKAREFLFGDFYLVKNGSEYGIKDVYCQRVVRASEFSGEKPGPNRIPDHRTVNAEHTWPQSKFNRSFPGEEQKSDMHHLFPTDSEMNSKRSSFSFGEVQSDAEGLKCTEARLGRSREGKRNVFEPPEEHKGNVARAIFYFAIRYKVNIGREEEVTLREWHNEDPVDEEEIRRNERIFDLQKSRNPFVDFPELVNQITDF